MVPLYVPYISKKSPFAEFSIFKPNFSYSGVCGMVVLIGDDKRNVFIEFMVFILSNYN